MISPKYLPELRRLPDDVLCSACAFDEVLPLNPIHEPQLTNPPPQTMDTRYTRINTHEPLNASVIKTMLNPSLRPSPPPPLPSLPHPPP